MLERICIDCGVALPFAHGNQKRCDACRKKHRRKVSTESSKAAHRRRPESQRHATKAWKRRNPEKVRVHREKYNASYYERVTKSKRQQAQ